MRLSRCRSRQRRNFCLVARQHRQPRPRPYTRCLAVFFHEPRCPTRRSTGLPASCACRFPPPSAPAAGYLYVRLSFACMKKVPFELQCADVHEYWNGHYARLMGSTIRLIHHPTGVEVVGEVPQVHNTKGKLRTAEAELRKALMTELTQKVAKHLRLPGR